MIAVQALTKRFGTLRAVDNLTFTAAAGTSSALWGANGAGKTTALRCLLGLIPFEGTITIDGIDVRRQAKEARRRIGFVPQALTFHDDLSVRETLAFYAGLKKVRDGARLQALLDQLGLTEYTERRVGDLSGGLKQRLALALALLADPPLLLLDEPTSNLDIGARDDFLALLQKQQQAGKTLIFSSHRFDEVTALADRVLLLEAGRLAADAPPRVLAEQLRQARREGPEHAAAERFGQAVTLYLRIEPAGITPALTALQQVGLHASPNGHGLRVQVAPDGKGVALRAVHEAGITIDDFAVE